MPSRPQIEPIEIPGILPIVRLAEVPPAVARMRLLGSEATNAYGREIRDCLIADIQLSEFTVIWQNSFLRLIQPASPFFTTGMYRWGRELCRVETVLTPLSDDG